MMQNDWHGLRVFYNRIRPAIMDLPKNEWACDPYEWDSQPKKLLVMTPIEAWLWSDIRHHGAVLYPQYPTGRFFVDFANPKAKVAIECDGAAFHRDKAKDAERDAVLAATGWTVYRITGADCRTDQSEDGKPGTASNFIKTICQEHRISQCS